MTIAELIEVLKKHNPNLEVESATGQKIVNVSQKGDKVTLVEGWMVEDYETPEPVEEDKDSFEQPGLGVWRNI